MTHQLLADLQHADAAVRFEAAQALSAHREPHVVEALLATLPDSDSKVQYAAFVSLIKIGAPEAAFPMINWLIDTPDCRLWGLMKLNIGLRLRKGLVDMVNGSNPQLVELLARALQDDSVEGAQRAMYIRLIGKTRDQNHVEPFLNLLAEPDLLISVAAAEALGYIGDARAVETLIALLTDKHGTSEQLRDVAAEALGRIGDVTALDPLIEALGDESEWVRRAAAAALGDLGDRRAMDALGHAISDPSTMVQDAAFESIKRFSNSNYSTIMQN